MTAQQTLALAQVPGLTLVAPSVANTQGVVARLDKRLFVLSRAGLLRRYR